MTEPPVNSNSNSSNEADAFLKSLFMGSLAIPTHEEIIAKLRACGDPRAPAIIKDIESEVQRRKTDGIIHPSGFRLLKGGKE